VRAFCNRPGWRPATSASSAYRAPTSSAATPRPGRGPTSGLDIVSLPLYYGLVEGAWRHWGRVWEVEYDWMASRFDTITGADGKPVKDDGAARHPVDALVRRHPAAQGSGQPEGRPQGHDGVRSRRQTPIARMPKAAEGIEKLDLLVVADPVRPPGRCCRSARTTPTCCRSRPVTRLPARAPPRTARSSGASRSSSRSSRSKDDNEVMYLLAKKLGFADKMFKNIKVENKPAVVRGPAARDQPRRLLDRLLRPVARAAEDPHGQPEGF